MELSIMTSNRDADNITILKRNKQKYKKRKQTNMHNQV